MHEKLRSIDPKYLALAAISAASALTLVTFTGCERLTTRYKTTTQCGYVDPENSEKNIPDTHLVRIIEPIPVFSDKPSGKHIEDLKKNPNCPSPKS